MLTCNNDFFPANWQGDRDGLPILAIVAHGTVGTDSRAYLKRGGELPDGSDRKVSIHYLIGRDGTIYRMVDESRAANHAGFSTWTDPKTGLVYQGSRVNRATIGIELESLQRGTPDDYTPAQLDALGGLIADIRQRRGALPILRHADIDPTRRRDPVGLSVAQIEQYVTRATTGPLADPFLAWGQQFPLPPEQRAWGIPQAWLAQRALLGAARSPEIDLGQRARAAVQVFEGGAIVYFRDSGQAVVTLRPARRA